MTEWNCLSLELSNFIFWTFAASVRTRKRRRNRFRSTSPTVASCIKSERGNSMSYFWLFLIML